MSDAQDAAIDVSTNLREPDARTVSASYDRDTGEFVFTTELWASLHNTPSRFLSQRSRRRKPQQRELREKYEQIIFPSLPALGPTGPTRMQDILRSKLGLYGWPLGTSVALA